MKAIVFGLLIIVACLCIEVPGFRLRLALSPDVKLPSFFDEDEVKIQTDACNDYVFVDKRDLFNIVGIRNPWENPNSVVYRSDTVTNELRSFFQNTHVIGITDSIQQILDFFITKLCFSFPFGGIVRDQFLARPSKDLDMDVSCSIIKFYDECVKKYGQANCIMNQKQTMVHVGQYSHVQEPIDAAYYEKNFFWDPSYLEYTTNALGYDSNENDVVIDVTSQGIADACNKKIRIPVPQNEWNLWLQHNPKSVTYRFWKLRGRDYTAIDAATFNFITAEAKYNIQTDTRSFQVFYCYTLIKGRYYMIILQNV